MFEHLGPLAYNRPKPKRWRHRFVVAFLFSLGIFFLALMTVPGPSSWAADTSPKVHWQSSALEQRVSKGSTQVQLFQLTIDSPVSGAGLQKMKIYVNGLYDAQYLSQLKLFHQGVQLGTLVDLDEQGYLNFNLNDYKLPAGTSQFVITLPETKAMATGTIMQFSIENRTDLELTYQNQRLIPTGKFPLVSGVTQIVDQGDWQVYNRTKQGNFVVPSQGRTLLGLMSLASGAELLDIKTIEFGLEQAKKQKNNNIEFVLINDGNIVATATSTTDKILFVINKPLVAKISSLLDIELYAKDLPVGDYLFSLKNITGKGYVSNNIISWTEPIVLSRVHSLSDYPIFESAVVDPSLRTGWNNVFSTKIKAVGKNKINFYKFTWYYKIKNATLRQAKVFVDSKYYPMDVIIKDNTVIAKAEWSNPLPINTEGHLVQLMLNIDQLGPDSVVEAYLQPDIITTDPDSIWDYNIVWSYDATNLKNSYLLPYLPLAPTILKYID